MIFLLLLALAVAAIVDHSYAIAGILGCAALFIALTEKS